MRGVCRAVCNSDSSCGQGQICENRICQVGCRSDTVCSSNQACINKHCTGKFIAFKASSIPVTKFYIISDPCSVLGQCGACSECSVVNHGVQCSCPGGFLGNPLTGCSLPPKRCNSYCKCDESGVFCAEACTIDTQCTCGQTCSAGKCRTKCNPGACPSGQLCQDGACIAGCRANLDCDSERSCINGQCLDPCARKDNTCGENALCKVSDHRVLCLCPDGYQGEPTQKCTTFECQRNEDCDNDKRCTDGSCKNPCLEGGACGINSQCRVVNRRSQCSCPPGHFGNPDVECNVQTPGTCLKNPCGENARCRELPGGYECSCAPGCIGDPRKGCVCDGQQVNICHNQPCGINALCRVRNHDEPECYCPSEYPSGDPYTECE